MFKSFFLFQNTQVLQNVKETATAASTGFNLDVGSIMSICSILLMGWSLWILNKGAKDRKMNMSEYLNVFFIEYADMFLLGFLFCSYLAEALIASNLHPKDSYVLMPSARFMNHISISLIGFICAIFSSKMLISFLQSLKLMFVEKNSKGEITRKASFVPILIGFMTILLLGGTLITPYMNCSIIAKGFGQSRVLDYTWDLFTQYLHPWSMTPKQKIAEYYGYTGVDAFRPTSELMDFNLYTSWMLCIAHIVGSFLKGGFAAIDSTVMGQSNYADKLEERLRKEAAKERVNTKLGNSNAASTGTNAPANNAAPANPPSNPTPPQQVSSIENCLKVFKLSDTERASHAKQIQESFKNQPTPQAAAGIAGQFGSYSTEVLDIIENKSGLTDTEKSESLSQIGNMIEDLIKSDVSSGGCGLALNLPPLD